MRRLLKTTVQSPPAADAIPRFATFAFMLLLTLAIPLTAQANATDSANLVPTTTLSENETETVC